MARKKRKVPEVNSSSTADIAFILLIFFLTATSMNTDKGLARQLPPPVPEELKNQESMLKKRNVLEVRVNSQNQVLCKGEETPISGLREIAKEFIENKNDDPDMPVKVIIKVPILGDIMSTKNHVISLQTDRGTKYDTYVAVQNELVAAYNELRDDFSKKRFGKLFAELDDEQQKAVRAIYPQKISEAEPREYKVGGK